MRTASYIFGNNIWVCEGQETSKKIVIEKLANETVVLEEEETYSQAVTRTIKNIWNKGNISKKNIRLVIDPGTMLAKKLNIPEVGKKDALKIVKNEFLTSSENKSEMLYDYIVLNRGKKKSGLSIMAIALELKLVLEYDNIFKKAGLSLKSIDVCLSSAIKYILNIPELAKKTYILGILSGNEIMLLLFVNGINYFFNRAALFETRGTPASAVEISRTISNILQFNMAQNTGADVSDVYVCGLIGAEKELREGMSDYLKIEVGSLPESLKPVLFNEGLLPEGQSISDYLFVVGGLLG